MVALLTALRHSFLSPEVQVLPCRSVLRHFLQETLTPPPWPFPPFVSHLCSMVHKDCRSPAIASPGERGHTYAIQHLWSILAEERWKMIPDINANLGSRRPHLHIYPSTHEENHVHTYMNTTHVNMKTGKNKTHLKGRFQQKNIYKYMVLKFIEK